MTHEYRFHEPADFAEIELIEFSGELPTVTPEFRLQILSSAKQACRRARLLQRVQVAAAAVLFCTGGALLGGYYLSMWSGATDRSSVAAVSSDQQSVPHDASEADGGGLDAAEITPRDQLLIASRSSDVWALVDAYDAFRLHGMQKLQIVSR